MPSLLTTSYRPAGSELLSVIASATMQGRQMDAQREQQAQSMALRLAEAAKQQQQFDAKLAFDREHELRVQQQAEFQNSLSQSAGSREQQRIDLLKKDSAPFVSPFGSSAGASSVGPTEGVDLFEAGNPTRPSDGLLKLGKITDYGQADDSTPDKYTQAGKSAIGNLRPDSLALSPDLEAKLKEQGVKIGTPVTLKLDDGTSLTRFWDDRTSKKLTGRVDLYSPDGPSPLRDKAVVDISPAQSLIQSFDRPPMTKQLAAEPSIPATSGPPPALRSMADMLVQSGASAGEGRKMLISSIPKLANAQAGDDLVSGMEPVPEHNTYRGRDGIEYFVNRTSDGKQKLVAYRPKEVVAKRFGQGDDGNVYAYGSNGEPMQPIPEGVSVELNPGKIQTTKDNLGNVFQLHRDSSVSLLIPAGVKMSAKDREALVADTEAFNTAKAEYEAKQSALDQNGEGWFGLTKSKAESAKKALDSASLKMKSWLQQYPALKPPGEAPVEPAAASVTTPAVASDKKTLAQQAIDDPNASEAHKAAARRILGL